MKSYNNQSLIPLLARGRDRLETFGLTPIPFDISIPYSLGDAIDWKHKSDLIAVYENGSPTR